MGEAQAEAATEGGGMGWEPKVVGQQEATEEVVMAAVALAAVAMEEVEKVEEMMGEA